MFRKLMLALAMAALMSFVLAGTAFAAGDSKGKGKFKLNQEATAVAIGGDGGDAVNLAKVTQVNAAEVEQANVAVIEGGDFSSNEINQTNAVVQANVADVDQTATGGDGGDAVAVAVNAFLVGPFPGGF